MSTKSDRQILIDARALILDEADWGQGNYSTTREDGRICRCTIGAGADAAGLPYSQFEISRLGQLLETQACKLLGLDPGKEATRHCYWTIEINDGERSVSGMTPHQAVIAMFDRAIEAAPHA